MGQSDDIVLHHCLQAAVKAARKAGLLLEQYARSGFSIEHKERINLVTDADRAAEQCVIASIQGEFRDHRFLAEERGRVEETASPFLWVIDPLDGTTNFAHGYPVYCVSIGLEYQGQCVLGAVFDPSRNELFTALRGEGAYLNGNALHVSNTAKLDQSLLVTGFAYDIREAKRNNLDHFASFALQCQGMRRTGSAALDLSYVAAGRFDGFWELKLNPWDMAAGSVIVGEAGGRVTNFRGGALSIYGEELVASNGQVHQAMLEVLGEERSPGRP
jgi:myo-inositol-1(or 4)-monophosphatase